MSINIVCTIDESYVQHCAVMLYSLHCQNSEENLKVFIIHNGLSNKSKEKMRKFLIAFVQILTFIEIKDSSVANFPVSHHVSIATYFRLFIPEMLPQDIDKVLFLDSDIVIRKSIIPLWEKDISLYSHAAVESINSEKDKERLTIPPSAPYFNAGMLLINLKFWREENILDRAVEFINNNNDKILWWDQDVLNFLLYNEWLPVEPTWNSQSNFYSKNYLQNPDLKSSEYLTAINDPAIVHFTGADVFKPWNYKCSHPFKNEYHEKLKQTPWATDPFNELLKRVKNKIRKEAKKRTAS